MSRHGNGEEYDITMKPSTYMKTTTSQYRLVGIQGATSSVEFTGYLCNNKQTLNDTTTARNAIGINQTMLSAGSETMQVRIFGISKARCESTITAGDWIVPYEGISTSTHPGAIVSMNLENEANVTNNAAQMSIAAFGVVMGRSFQDGITNTVIEVMLNPQLYDFELWAGKAY